MKYSLLPCPFCNFAMPNSEALDDTLYPSGICWSDFWNGETKFRRYFKRDSEVEDGQCWILICNTSAGGCGAEMHGDSEAEVVAKWNRRAPTHDTYIARAARALVVQKGRYNTERAYRTLEETIKENNQQDRNAA